jgi:Raf kinase inhibitor-like YbhB/YbcL family protein
LIVVAAIAGIIAAFTLKSRSPGVVHPDGSASRNRADSRPLKRPRREFVLAKEEDVHVLRLQSPAFDDGQEMAQKYGNKVDNISPPLEWDGTPEGTKALALACVDIHPVARNFVHWLVADIPPQTNSLPEGAAGASSPGFTEIKPYVGPFPPSGTHDYEFTLYALRVERLGVRPGATLQQFRQTATQNSLATATLIGKFTKTR